MLRKLVRTALVVALLQTAGPAPASAADGTVADRPTVMRLEPYRKGVALRVVANGRPGLFTFDTAGGITAVSPDFAKAVGCRPWGQLVGHQMTGNKLATPRCDDFAFGVGGVALKAPVAAVLDVAPLIAKDAPPIDGLMALDVFAGQTITVDAAAGELTIETPTSLARRIQGATELPVRIAREVGGVALTVFVEVPTPNGIARLEIDSGNGGTILVSKPYAASLGLDPDADGPQQGAFEIGAGIRAQGLIFTPDLIIDGNLGMPFLKDWALTLDLKEGRMWLKRSRATPPKGMGEPPPLPNK
ncbi:hypothetical protein E2493_06070 [Sphingomonas parva]|uniref:Aspartyl protease n=1 Tax=Sphingomonas parva TaxID=2555898 RepID=A0A4Y8ZSU9_9SPHN|nr:hypothetical protein [Sphingomonas parva]TFI59090.1 hypothetical protein E2493_06070 [Sphingomonas parva]